MADSLERDLYSTPAVFYSDILGMLTGFFFAVLGEEIGWMGYGFGTIQARSNALQASILLRLI